MASGGEVGGTLFDNIGSEDLDDVKCQPCQDDGEILEAVGMCTDCQEYLCVRDVLMAIKFQGPLGTTSY